MSLPNISGIVASRGSERAAGSAPLGSKKNRGLLLRSRKMRFRGFSTASLGYNDTVWFKGAIMKLNFEWDGEKPKRISKNTKSVLIKQQRFSSIHSQ